MAGLHELGTFFGPEAHSYVDAKFDEFKEKHGKQYDDDDEHDRRKNIFRHNLRYVNSQNRGREGNLRLAINHLADLTEEEMVRTMPLKAGVLIFTDPHPENFFLAFAKTNERSVFIRRSAAFTQRTR